MVVGQELHLDVPGALEVALAEDGAVAERRFSLALRCCERLVELRRRADEPHPPAATPCRGLDQQRETDLLRLTLREHRHAGVDRDLLRRKLVAAQPERLGRRPDPRQPRIAHCLGEQRALGEKPVARMNGIGV